MTEIFYFAFADLMILSEYIRETNSLRYSSHRKMIYVERAIIEQYLLRSLAPKTEYYKKSPSFLVYTGVDDEVKSSFEYFKAHGKSNVEVATIEKKAADSASNLIHESMKGYYFEKIGDVLVKMKTTHGDDLIILQSQLEELVVAYNIHSDKEINVKEFIKHG